MEIKILENEKRIWKHIKHVLEANEVKFITFTIGFLILEDITIVTPCSCIEFNSPILIYESEDYDEATLEVEGTRRNAYIEDDINGESLLLGELYDLEVKSD